MSEDKSYTATLKLGLVTDTEDITGEVLRKCDTIPDEDTVRSAILSFIGEYDQVPPMYSALKVEGRKLVDIAREGGEVERKARRVTINGISCKMIGPDLWEMEVDCSKGTYIRTLCADIGEKLGCGGVMASLRRTRAGAFTIEDAHTIEELDSMTEEEILSLVKPVADLFPDFAPIRLGDFFAKLAKSGTEVYLKKIRCDLPAGTYVRLFHGDDFFAIGRVDEYEAGLAIRPLKQIVL